MTYLTREKDLLIKHIERAKNIGKQNEAKIAKYAFLDSPTENLVCPFMDIN
jgi:hypothetical protein